MSDVKKSRGNRFRDWLSKVLHPVRGTKSKALYSNDVKKRPAQDTTSEDDVAQHNGTDECAGLIQTKVSESKTCDEVVDKTTIPVELSEELKALLKDGRFELLSEALREEGITTIQQLREVQIWTFLNRHSLYPIAERVEVFDYLKDQMSIDLDSDGKQDMVDEIPGRIESEINSVIESESDFKREDSESSTEALVSDLTLRSGDYANSKEGLEAEKIIKSTEQTTTTGRQDSAESINLNVENINMSEDLQKEESDNSKEVINTEEQTIDKHTKKGIEQVSDASKQAKGLTSTEKPSNLIKTSPAEPYGSIKEPSSTPYYEIYTLVPDGFRSFLATECGFSVRVSNRLRRNNIRNVGELLEQSDEKMLSIKGFGVNSLKELHAYFKRLKKSNLETHPKKTTRIKFPSELQPYTRYLCEGDFVFAVDQYFSKQSLNILAKYMQAHEDLDQELIDSIVKRDPGALSIFDMLSRFVTDEERAKRCQATINSIPEKRRCLQANTAIRYFTSDEKRRLFLESQNDSENTLEQYICANEELIIRCNAQFINFLRWCSYNIITEINEFFDKQLESDRVRRIFCGRVRGETLLQLGDEFGITRERVRQIEAKVFRKSKTWFRQNRVIYKLFLDLDDKGSLSASQIIEHVGQYGEETVYLLKRLSGTGYYYNDRFDLFTLDHPIDCEVIQTFIDTMPDSFSADKLDEMIADGAYRFGFSEDFARVLFDDSFRRTGDLYHRSRLTLSSIYSEIIRKYYPNGIHLDDEEMVFFRDHVKDEFGIDISDKNTNAIGSIINRTCILCGRGRYRLKTEGPYLSENLTKQIRDYVENSTTTIMLISTIFSEFEEELREEGVTNRYYLQGILKEVFGDIWFFKRDYVTTDSNVTSFYDAVLNYISKGTSPISKEAVMKQFPGITDIVINCVVSGSEIINLFGSYIHASKLNLSEVDIHYLRNKLDDSLATEDVCYSKDLYTIIKHEKPWLLSNNYITAGFGLYSLLEYLFSDNYNFSRPFIAKEGAEIRSIYSVMREMVAESEVVEVSEIRSFASEHNYQIQRILDFINSCNETHLMINAQELATFEYIGIDEDTVKQISQCILAEVRDAIPISNLTCIHHFPKLKVEWNAWLIYSILNKWSKDLVVGTSKAPFRLSYPVVALSGSTLEVDFDDTISHNGELFCADNLDNIEDLIADFIFEELEDIDEF